MESTINVFTEGLTSDMHPLTTLKGLLTDALNATLRTYNGNEMILLNDMGNTMIQDSTTGNIMGLRDGFVPVGIKEYGGILYIASYNPLTKESQLGTIPSPVINYDYPETPKDGSMMSTPITGSNNINYNSLLNTEAYYAASIQLCDVRLCVGDQFIPILDFGNIEHVWRKIIIKNSMNNLIEDETHVCKNFDMITGWDTSSENIIAGLFKVILEAKVENGVNTISLDNISNVRLKYYLQGETESTNSKYWFINLSDCKKDGNYVELDTNLCLADNQYRSYPNILPGYLYARCEPELPIKSSFNFVKNISTGLLTPNYYAIYNYD